MNYGNELITRLDTDRNHYEVYQIMAKAYPDDWVERYQNYSSGSTGDRYRIQYEEMKPSAPIRIAYARLVADTLRSIEFTYVLKRVPRDRLCLRNATILDRMIDNARLDLEGKKALARAEEVCGR